VGLFPTTDRGNVYMMIAVECPTRFIVAVPIPNKEPDTVACYFRHHVLRVYGDTEVVVTDQGNEFLKA
jgi:hypothetical protein